MSTRIYTKTGDKGTTGLFGGQRLSKADLRIEVYGTVDELNAMIGVALSHDPPALLADELTTLSALLFSLGSDLATPLYPPPAFDIPRIKDSQVQWLERCIDAHDEQLSPLKNFILPGGTQCAAFLHSARTICRRAERSCVALAEREDIGEVVVKFLNRCSDYLFSAARMANHLCGVVDVPWTAPKD